MSRLWQRLLIVFFLLFAAIQFIRPSMSNPPANGAREVTAVHPTPPEVVSTLQRSCNDCHSNRTVWPWYSQVAPASWLVAHDVNAGREALNFSEWSTYSPEKAQKQLGEICEQVRASEMPVTQYTLLHPRARLTRADVQAICNWTGPQAAEQEGGQEE